MKTFRNVFQRALVLCAGLVLAGGAFTSCKDNDDEYKQPEAVIAPGEVLTFKAEGEAQKITLETNRKWTAAASQSSWLSVDPSQGEAGRHTLTVTALPNKGAERKADILFTFGSLKKTVKVTQSASSNPGETPQLEGMPLADFLEKYKNAEHGAEVTDEAFIQAVVISDLKSNNVPTNKVLTVQAGEVGMVVAFGKQLTPKGQEPEYLKGEVIKINLKGTKISTQFGFQLDVSAKLPTAVEKTGQTMEIQPKVVSLEEVLTGKYQNILVRIDNVQFAKPGSPLNDLQQQGNKFPTKHNAITDCVTKLPEGVKNISVDVSYFANTLKKVVASDRKGSMTGIIVRSAKGDYFNLWIRDINDLNLTEEPCKKEDNGGGSTPNPDPGTPAPEVSMSLYDFINQYDGKGVIQENVVFSGSLLFSMGEDNYKSDNLVIQSGTTGLTIYLPGLANTVVKDMKHNMVVNIHAKGGKLERYNNGGLQLNLKGLSNPNDLITNANKIAAIAPKEVTLADVYAGKYENILVKVKGIQFKDQNTVYQQYNVVTDCDAQPTEGNSELQVNIAKGFALLGQALPAKRGSMTGVLTRSASKTKKYWNLWIRGASDLELNEDRCGATPPDPDPNPQPNPTPNPNGDVMFISYVEGSVNNKYIALYNPTDKAIDLAAGKYSIVLQTYTSSNSKGRTEPKKDLSGTLEPGAVIVYGYQQGGIYKGTIEANKQICQFNGNDNLALMKGKERIDVIGTAWGTAWLSGNQPAGADKTLHRKVNVNSPNATFNLDEWEVLGIDNISKLGKR